MAARYYCPQSWDRRRGWIDHAGYVSHHESYAIRKSIEVAEHYRVLTRVIRKPHGWTPPSPLVFVDPQEVAPEELVANLEVQREALKVALDNERVANLRKHEKARRRKETAKLRQPTAWDVILREDEI